MARNYWRVKTEPKTTAVKVEAARGPAYDSGVQLMRFECVTDNERARLAESLGQLARAHNEAMGY